MHVGILNTFSQDGYVVLDDFLTAKEVEELKEAGNELIQNVPKDTHKAVFSTTDVQQSKDKYFLDSSDKVSYFFEASAVGENGELLVDSRTALNKVGHALHWLNPTFKKYTFCEKVKETCFLLGLVEPVIVQSMYIFKSPGVGSEVAAHQDATFLHTDPVKLVGFWIALEDATLENGCLWFAPGSHKSGVHRRFIRNRDPTSEQLLIYDAQAPCYPTSNFQPVPVNKGKGFPHLEEADVLRVLSSHAVQLTEEKLQQLTALSEPEVEDSDAVVGRTQLTASAVKQGSPDGACVLIHGQVVHRSEPNKSEYSRHAYTFHVVDMNGTTYSSDNWLQPNPDQPFPNLYKN